MPLSKKRNRDRMRKYRLHKLLSPPQESKSVQPNASFVKSMSLIVKGLDSTTIDIEKVKKVSFPKIDADGNSYYDNSD